MNTGVISVRYARALLKAACEQGIEDKVYAIMQTLAHNYLQVPELRMTMKARCFRRTRSASYWK